MKGVGATVLKWAALGAQNVPACVEKIDGRS